MDEHNKRNGGSSLSRSNESGAINVKGKEINESFAMAVAK